MNIKIKSITLRNFKGLRDVSFDFDGRNATIIGDNGTGKTTIFDALTWVLFGKDSHNSTDIDIKTIDATGEPMHRAEDVVTTGVSSLETKRVIEEAGGICLGITCVVDRTRPEAPSPIPILASALKLDLPNYAPEECPICKEGKLPLVHLGSRKMKEAAKQTL